MRKTPWLATLVLGLALASCQDTSSTSSAPESGGIGGIALGFSARTLDTLRVDSDSLLLTLAGPMDTIRSISRLGDTLRFEGLRTGSWSLLAEVFSSDSGERERTWEGSANAWVQPGRLSRVSLVLRRATGSLVVDVRLDDGPDGIYDDSCWRGGGADTTCLYYPPTDTTSTGPGTGFPPSDSITDPDFLRVQPVPADWIVDSLPWVATPSTMVVAKFWEPILLNWSSRPGYLKIRANIRGGNTTPWVSIVEDDSCGRKDACPLRLRVHAKVPAGGVVDSFANRVAIIRVDLNEYPQVQKLGLVLMFDANASFLITGLRGSAMGACDIPAGSGLVSCPDSATTGIRYKPAT